MSKAVPKVFEKCLKLAGVCAEFEADSVQNRVFLYTVGTLSMLPVAEGVRQLSKYKLMCRKKVPDRSMDPSFFSL